MIYSLDQLLLRLAAFPGRTKDQAFEDARNGLLPIGSYVLYTVSKSWYDPRFPRNHTKTLCISRVRPLSDRKDTSIIVTRPLWQRRISAWDSFGPRANLILYLEALFQACEVCNTALFPAHLVRRGRSAIYHAEAHWNMVMAIDKHGEDFVNHIEMELVSPYHRCPGETDETKNTVRDQESNPTGISLPQGGTI